MKFIHILSFVCLFYEVINRKTKRSKNKREYFKYVTTPGHKITDISDFYFEFDGKSYYPRQESITKNNDSDKLNLRENGDLNGGLSNLYYVTDGTNPGNSKIVKLMNIQKYDNAKKMEESIKTYIENHHKLKEKFGEDTVLSEIEAFKVYEQTN